jgi:hypothetical protein
MFKIFNKYIVEKIFKMQRLEVSCAVRRIYKSLGAKGLKVQINLFPCFLYFVTDLGEIPRSGSPYNAVKQLRV